MSSFYDVLFAGDKVGGTVSVEAETPAEAKTKAEKLVNVSGKTKQTAKSAKRRKSAPEASEPAVDAL